jgi:hypothetical protein
MGQRDAFGNPVGGDPIQEMGWDRPDGSAVGAHPQEEHQAQVHVGGESPMHGAEQLESLADRLTGGMRREAGERPSRPPSSPPPVQIGRVVHVRASRTVGWLITLVILAAVVLPVAGVYSTVRDAFDGVSTALDEIERATPAPSPAPPAAPAEAAGEESPAAAEAESPQRTPTQMPSTGAMRRMLADLQRVAGPRKPLLIVVRPERIDMQVANRDGNVRNLSVVPGGRAQDVSSGGQAGARKRFRWGQIDPAAPSRLRRAVKRPEYAVLSHVIDLRWNVFREGRMWTARPDGRGVQRMG